MSISILISNCDYCPFKHLNIDLYIYLNWNLGSIFKLTHEPTKKFFRFFLEEFSLIITFILLNLSRLKPTYLPPKKFSS